MSAPIDDTLADSLEKVAAAAEQLQAELADEQVAATEAATDLGEVAASGSALERFVADVEEAVRQLFVAGLSFPDPELADELASLAERATRHGLPTALRHLSSLKLWLEAIGQCTTSEQRHDLAGRAWQQTQQLVSWLRLFRVELDFLTVEASLATSTDDGVAVPRQQDYPTRSLSAWPLGIELERGGKLLLFAIDVDTRRPVVLRDQLSEFDADSPFSRPVISRLMQDAIELKRAMGSLIRLEDHPVIERRDSLLFRPAFRTVPKLLPVAETFAPPAIPELTPAGPWNQPGWFDATLSYSNGRLRWTGNPRSVELADIGRLNIIKLMAREGCRSARMRVTARPKGDTLRILCAETHDEGRLFLCDDPSLFRLAPTTLAAAASASAARLEDSAAPVATLLQTAAFLFGGADSETVDALRGRLDEIGGSCRGLVQHYRLGLCRFLLGLPGDRRAEPLVDATLQLALVEAGAPVPEDALSEVLGHPAHASDLRRVDDALLYRALWLAHECDLGDGLAQPLSRLATTRYGGKMKAKGPAAVCARALCHYLVDAPNADDIDPDDIDPDEIVEDDPNDDGTEQFFEAHLDDIIGRGRRRSGRPLPELIELVQLGDTRALINGFDRAAGTVAELGVAQLTLARRVADALFSWRNDDANSGIAEQMAAALLVVAAGGLRELFIA